MRSHLLTPEQAMFRTYYDEVNRVAWSLRRVTGEDLHTAMQMVPEAMREDVKERVQFIQKRHGMGEEH